ncbi:MAG TPA: Os1348 family NHLP clan protein [Ktedonosporobacter sp.]|jgi:hypothetical protein|nr:Os1348 family NHLP clan protein [Ktedonosporobacter sp.]
MSWKIINRILGLATIDQDFAQKLLTDPLPAIQDKGFQLTNREREVFSEISASTLNELSQQLMQKLSHDDVDRS